MKYCNKIINSNWKALKFIILSKRPNNHRTYTSALFIPNNRAHKTFAFLVPNINYFDYLHDIEKLKKQLNLRNFQVNAEELQKNWNYFQDVKSNKLALENKLSELSNKIIQINKNTDFKLYDKKEVDDLIQKCRYVKQDIKFIKEAIWALEETFIPQLLKLPNEVDERTPEINSIVMRCKGEKPYISENKGLSHLEIGKKLGLLDCKSLIHCYLCNEAVLFELEVLALAGRILNESGSMRIAAPDFCRSILVEGSGMNHESSEETFLLKSKDNVETDYLVNRLHLVGGANLPAVLAMFTKQIIKNNLPFKVFTSGRQYAPFRKTSMDNGLFSLCQASVVHALTFVEQKNSEEYYDEFQNMIEVATKIYDEIGCHYRIVIRPANELHVSESMRASFEMWSVHLNDYVEVGHVSACGDYVSNRLLITYKKLKKYGYLSIISGTLLSVPRILGCLLEENPEKFIIPKALCGFIK